MSKQVVLITGALTGIGRATALAFARDGEQVVVSGRRDDTGMALVEEIRNIGAEAEFIRADVRHEDDVRALRERKLIFGSRTADGETYCGVRSRLPTAEWG
jgi:NAD(P)-dependent dehydrogenase (short-subunit alcohol dehydrogenase family)